MTNEHLQTALALVRPDGLRRIVGETSTWVDSEGRVVDDPETLRRLKRLAIPPAWTHVWAAADGQQRIQATGIDLRGRTQYRYSDEALRQSSADKFAHMIHFASSLPKLRTRVSEELATSHSGLSVANVTAAVVRFLDRGLLRVGNDRYLNSNHTFGLTTLRKSHASVEGDRVLFRFVGKEHLLQSVEVADPDGASVVRRLLALPGQDDDPLFCASDAGTTHHINSAAVNSYIHAHGSSAGTAKTFRTWGATVAAAAVSSGADVDTGPRTSRQARPYRAAAALLGNTPAVARASYVHPRAVAAGDSKEVHSALALAVADVGSTRLADVLHHPVLQAAVLTALSEDRRAHAPHDAESGRRPAQNPATA